MIDFLMEEQHQQTSSKVFDRESDFSDTNTLKCTGFQKTRTHLYFTAKIPIFTRKMTIYDQYSTDHFLNSMYFVTFVWTSVLLLRP